jgi:hypothetical protein
VRLRLRLASYITASARATIASTSSGASVTVRQPTLQPTR